MINLQSQPTFTGTIQRKSDMSMSELKNKFRNYFDFKTLSSEDNPADVLESTQAGVLKTEEGRKFIGQDEKADKMIYHLLQKFDKSGKYEYVEEDWPLEDRIDKKPNRIDFTA